MLPLLADADFIKNHCVTYFFCLYSTVQCSAVHTSNIDTTARQSIDPFYKRASDAIIVILVFRIFVAVRYMQCSLINNIINIELKWNYEQRSTVIVFYENAFLVASSEYNEKKTHQWFNTNVLGLLCILWHWKLQHHVQINYQCLTEQDRTFCREIHWKKEEKNSLKFCQSEFFVWFLFIFKFQFTKALVWLKVKKNIALEIALWFLIKQKTVGIEKINR